MSSKPVEEEKNPAASAKFKGGASSTSIEHPSKQSRALAYSNPLRHLAVANDEGLISVRQVNEGGDLN